MVASFSRSCAASFREARMSARGTAAKNDSARSDAVKALRHIHFQMVSRRSARRARLLRLWPRPVRARTRNHLQLAALHHLFEHPELRLLLQVEHLVDRLVRLLEIVGDAH